MKKKTFYRTYVILEIAQKNPEYFTAVLLVTTVNKMLVASSVCDVGPSVMWVPL